MVDNGRVEEELFDTCEDDTPAKGTASNHAKRFNNAHNQPMVQQMRGEEAMAFYANQR